MRKKYFHIICTNRKPADDVIRTERERLWRVLKPISFVEIRSHCPSMWWSTRCIEINKIAESLFFAGDEFVNGLVYFIEDSNSILNAASASGEVEAVVEHVAAIASKFLVRCWTCDFVIFFAAANACWLLVARAFHIPGHKCRARARHVAVTKNLRKTNDSAH
jgi:hypothetical protein